MKFTELQVFSQGNTAILVGKTFAMRRLIKSAIIYVLMRLFSQKLLKSMKNKTEKAFILKEIWIAFRPFRFED